MKPYYIKFIKIANLLDKNGFYHLATIIDKFLKISTENNTLPSKVCRNCKKTYHALFKGWHEQFCSKFCEKRFKEKNKK